MGASAGDLGMLPKGKEKEKNVILYSRLLYPRSYWGRTGLIFVSR
jgi:hypothetical protein